MTGTITFATWVDLAEFLKAFTPCTATFEVRKVRDEIVLTFTGGY